MNYDVGSLKKAYSYQARTGEDTGLAAIMFGLKTKYERDFLKFYAGLIEFYDGWIKQHKRIPKHYREDLAKVKSSKAQVEAAIVILNKMIGSSKTGVTDKEINELFGMIHSVEEQTAYWFDRSKQDAALKKRLDEMEEKQGVSAEDLSKTHGQFQSAIKGGGITQQSFAARMKELAPEMYGVGKYAGQQAMVGLLGPLAVPAQFLAGTAGKLMAEHKAKKAATARSTFHSQIGVSDAYEKEYSTLQSGPDKLSKSVAGYRDPSAFPKAQATTSAGGSISAAGIGGGKSSGGASSLYAFFDKEAYKTKYLADLMKAIKGEGGGKSSGGGFGALLGGLTAGVGAFASGALAGLLKGGVWGALAQGLGNVMKGIPILSKLGGALVKFAGPIGLIITAIQGIWGAVTGWQRAADIFGETPTLMEKFASGVGGAIESLTFGLVKNDWTAPILANFMQGTADFFKNLLANMWGGVKQAFGGILKIGRGDIFGGIKDVAKGTLKSNPFSAAVSAFRGGSKDQAKESDAQPLAVNNASAFEEARVSEVHQQNAQVVATKQLTAQVAKQNEQKAAAKGSASLPDQRKSIPYREDDTLIDTINRGKLSLSE